MLESEKVTVCLEESKASDKDQDIFYNHYFHELFLWETCLLTLWSWSIICYKLCERMHKLCQLLKTWHA